MIWIYILQQQQQQSKQTKECLYTCMCASAYDWVESYEEMIFNMKLNLRINRFEIQLRVNNYRCLLSFKLFFFVLSIFSKNSRLLNTNYEIYRFNIAHWKQMYYGQ